jgi:hypothetical protein
MKEKGTVRARSAAKEIIGRLRAIEMETGKGDVFVVRICVLSREPIRTRSIRQSGHSC